MTKPNQVAFAWGVGVGITIMVALGLMLADTHADAQFTEWDGLYVQCIEGRVDGVDWADYKMKVRACSDQIKVVRELKP